MKCCEEVMVTLRFALQGRCLDMELPLFCPGRPSWKRS